MTVEEMNKWKSHGKLWYKHKNIVAFWKTNPTDEQERLRGKIATLALYVGLLTGFVVGFCLGVLQ